ncbi:nucleotidyltransferase domain-containing protein [Methylobacterium sp. C1]|uniref:nucleotidyltransferase domain-containing protein n=1 Tax=Methylobacterium sp. C1 TaxID=1479019 RepID=UPI000A64A74E|nr:nucleotidyltransferase domain-containing protein [Methylobacterium sp. C1]
MTMPASVAELVPTAAEYPVLKTLMDRIKAIYDPEEVLLFGSRAKGTAGPDSDWDVLVVLPDDADERLLDPSLGYETQRGSGVYADVLCSLRSEFLSDITVANSRTREIVGHAVRVLTR